MLGNVNQTNQMSVNTDNKVRERLSPPKPDEEYENEVSKPATEKDAQSFWKRNRNAIIASCAVVALVVGTLVLMHVTTTKKEKEEKEQTEEKEQKEETEEPDEIDAIDDSVRKILPLRYHDPLFHPTRQRVSSSAA